MGSAKYEGVILAAGHGSRMGPFGDAVPKPIAPICNQPLLVYQLETMKAAGITDIVIVIGHLGDRIKDALGDGSQWGVSLRYVEQVERLGLAHAVGQLEAHMTAPFMLMLGDIFFDVNDIAQMTALYEEGDTAAVLAVKEESDPEAIKRNFSVNLDADGLVSRVIEKPRRVTNRLKGCGIYFFDERIFEAVCRTPRTAMRDEYELTDSIQILVDYQYGVKVAPVVDWDINLTFIGDLVRCSVHELSKRKLDRCIGEDCYVGDSVSLIDTVLGDGVTVDGSVRLERCVVLSGVRHIEPGHHIDAVITPDGILKG